MKVPKKMPCNTEKHKYCSNGNEPREKNRVEEGNL